MSTVKESSRDELTQELGDLHKSLRQRLKRVGWTHKRGYLDEAGKQGDIAMLRVYDKFLFSGHDISVLTATVEAARKLGIEPEMLDEQQFQAQHEARRILVRSEAWTTAGYEEVRMMLLTNPDRSDTILKILQQRGVTSSGQLREVLAGMDALPLPLEDGLL